MPDSMTRRHGRKDAPPTSRPPGVFDERRLGIARRRRAPLARGYDDVVDRWKDFGTHHLRAPASMGVPRRRVLLLATGAAA